MWEYASGTVAAMVGAVTCDCRASLASYVLGYRLLAIGLAGLCGVLIYTITAYRSPQLAPAALLAWLWNPLLLTATAMKSWAKLSSGLWPISGRAKSSSNSSP